MKASEEGPGQAAAGNILQTPRPRRRDYRRGVRVLETNPPVLGPFGRVPIPPRAPNREEDTDQAHSSFQYSQCKCGFMLDVVTTHPTHTVTFPSTHTLPHEGSRYKTQRRTLRYTHTHTHTLTHTRCCLPIVTTVTAMERRGQRISIIGDMATREEPRDPSTNLS
jgi:hypothetical protein